MLEPEAHIGVLVKGTILGVIDVRGLERNRLIAVSLGQLDPAVPVAVLDVGSAENDEAGFKLLSIENEGHENLNLCRFCVEKNFKPLLFLTCVWAV